MRRRLAAIVLTLGGALGLAACAPAEPITVDSDTVIIDVRTPSEFAGGHLEGAINIDVQSPNFDAEIAALDPAGDYVVYCRSGNRSAAAIDRMEAAGFTALVNAGSVAQASEATGIEVVTP